MPMMMITTSNSTRVTPDWFFLKTSFMPPTSRDRCLGGGVRSGGAGADEVLRCRGACIAVGLRPQPPELVGARRLAVPVAGATVKTGVVAVVTWVVPTITAVVMPAGPRYQSSKFFSHVYGLGTLFTLAETL